MASIRVDNERCKACELCIEACPKKILKLSEELNSKGFRYTKMMEPEKCIGCAFCATICPDTAIVEVEK